MRNLILLHLAALTTSVCCSSVAGLAVAAEIAGTGSHAVDPLWPAGAPGSETRKDEPEKVVGNNVSNIHFPTLTVYHPAKDKASECAVIVCPGGGHRNLVMQKEGYDISEGLAKVHLLFKQAGVPVELHIYAGIGHGFGLRHGPASGWADRFREWLVNQNFIPAPTA
ncbi:MAG TPA: hypothetical protein VGA56_25290 [Opitutaceae bacterium]